MRHIIKNLVNMEKRFYKNNEEKIKDFCSLFSEEEMGKFVEQYFVKQLSTINNEKKIKFALNFINIINSEISYGSFLFNLKITEKITEIIKDSQMIADFISKVRDIYEKDSFFREEITLKTIETIKDDEIKKEFALKIIDKIKINEKEQFLNKTIETIKDDEIKKEFILGIIDKIDLYMIYDLAVKVIEKIKDKGEKEKFVNQIIEKIEKTKMPEDIKNGYIEIFETQYMHKEKQPKSYEESYEGTKVPTAPTQKSTKQQKTSKSEGQPVYQESEYGESKKTHHYLTSSKSSSISSISKPSSISSISEVSDSDFSSSSSKDSYSSSSSSKGSKKSKSKSTVIMSAPF